MFRLTILLLILFLGTAQSEAQESKSKADTSTVVISGKVLNLETDSPMSVKLFVYDLTDNHQVTSTVSDPTTGEYHIVLHYGQHYGIGAHINDYLPIFEELHLVEKLDEHEIERNIYMAPLVKGEIVPLTNVHFMGNGKKMKEMSYMALDELVNVMKRHPEMKIEIKGLKHFGKAGYTEDHALKSAKAIAKYLRKHGIDKDRITFGVIDEADLHVPSDFQEIFEVELIIKEI